MTAVKRELAHQHSGIVITGGDFQQAIRDGMVQERLMAMLSGFFGTVAVVLAVIGLYGVISYVVGSRWSEFGIRLALGAAPRQVIRMILREVCALVAIGTLMGIVLSLLAGRAAASLLFGLRPYDPLTVAGASILLTAISLLASSVPARRASKIDPVTALRYE
jgi:ABC-type antimicrobial peptide transport system permease subunit